MESDDDVVIEEVEYRPPQVGGADRRLPVTVLAG